jgi:hypothetical protein
MARRPETLERMRRIDNAIVGYGLEHLKERKPK